MTKYKGATPGDLLIHEESAIVCRESTVVTNPTASDYTAPVGSPLKSDGTIALATEEGSVVGLLLEEVALSASQTTALQYGMLARGPAAINGMKIPADDPAGGSYTMATIQSTLEALGIEFRDEPTKKSVQIN